MIDFLGLFTLVNVLWALSVFCIIGAAFWIFVLYIVPLMKGLPIELFEIFLYVCDVLLFYGAHSLSLTSPHTNSHVFLAFLACLGVPCLYLFTLATHISDDTNNAELAFKVCAYVCSAVWSYAAVFFSSQLIGFIAVAAFFVALGFMFLPLPFVYVIGFNEKNGEKSVIPRAMGASFYLVAAYVYAATHGLMENVVWHVFRPGVLGFGTFVFFLGGLIISNRHYHVGGFFEKKGVDISHYLWTNLVMTVCGMMAIAAGSVVSELHLLKSVGGTFFCLYVLEKYLEIPWRAEGFVWMMLGVGLFLYGLMWFASEHPEYVLSVGNLF